MQTIFYIALGFCICACILTAVLSRRFIAQAYTSIDNIMDCILKGDIMNARQTIKDTRISKLSHKAARVIDKCTLDVEHINGEKHTIQTFVSDMLHQMKTPLSGILLNTSILLEGNLSEDERQEFLRRIAVSAEKLQWMTDCLTKLSRLEAGTVELAPRDIHIKQTISDSISSVAGASKKAVAFRITDFEDMKLLHDRKWTLEALSNILENAVKYSFPRSEIIISLEQLPLYTKISVMNIGMGIAKDELNLIFQRFYRGKNNDSEGVGLGLYLARLIMEKQGGYIMADSQPCDAAQPGDTGAKTTFSLFLQNCKN